jgi:TolB protein
MKKYYKLIFLVFLSTNILHPLAAIDVYLTLSSHNMRSAMGIAGFFPVTPTVEESKYSRQIQEVLTNDLLFSRYFNIVDGGPLYTGKIEEIKAWESIGISVLVTGNITIDQNKVTLKGQLFDISGELIWEKSFEGETSSYRSLAHKLSDEIVKHFIGEKGIAQTRIVFSNNKTLSKELYIIDYDGYNLKRLTFNNSINILPRWSPEGDEIVYTTYAYGNPDLYAISMQDHKRRKISADQGLNTSANFSPDGKQIVLTKSQGSYPNLFLIEKSGKMIKKLTYGADIQTSPSFAPNGKEIVYVSDISGNPQAYIMNLEGGNTRRIFTEGIVDSPSWSPRGDKIVFSMRFGRENYDIYVYDLSSARMARLTQNEGSNENPSWSPDGRFVVFSSNRSSKRDLYVIAIDGSGVRKLFTMQGSSYTPNWSP